MFWEVLLFPVLNLPYRALNYLVLVKVFGCPCENPDFNANDITRAFWIIIGIITVMFSILNIRQVSSKKAKLWYVLAILIITVYSVFMAIQFSSIMVWD